MSYERVPAGGDTASITTELTDLDSIQTLSLEEAESGAPPPPSPSSGKQHKHNNGGGGHHGAKHGEGAGHHHKGGGASSSSSSSSSHHKDGKEEEESGGGCLAGLKHMSHGHGGHRKHHHQGRAPRLPPGVTVPAHASGGSIILPAGANPDLVVSGHQDLQTLYATNDTRVDPITVNVCNAPNSSTTQCGCENINCPFCNLMLSIEKTDPTVLQ